ncbi:MAG: hypothetical protein JNL12_05110 [Planctomycetes bacterium]|jgi:hypothetical protein|nr:hypothetical protein [Planctomycetota bacterium]
MPRTRRFAFSLALVAASCTSHHRLGLQLPPAATAELLVTGSEPFVQVDNGGPGQLDVQFTDAAGVTDRTRIGPGCLARTMRGGGAVRLTSLEATATAVLQVTGGDGVSLQRPAPDRTPAPR